MSRPRSTIRQASAAAALPEAALYAPVRDFLAAQGFTVRGEVVDCDIAAVRGDDLVVVELKLGLTVDLLAQAVRRQRKADSVYVAVPRPAATSQWRRLRETFPLVRRLELGLLLVDRRDPAPRVEVAVQPLPAPRRRDAKGRRSLLREIAGRSGDDNAGGANRRPLVTAYREAALRVAWELQRHGPQSPKALRERGTGPRTLAILRGDVYGWFERVDRALYRLRPAGEEGLQRYADVVARWATGAKVAEPGT